MSFRTTGILLAALIVLGLFVYFYEMRTPKTTETAAKDKALELYNFQNQAASFALIEIKQGDKTTRLTSTDGLSWNLESPEKAPADTSRVSQIISEITVLKAISVVSDNPDDLPKYGLDNPTITVSVGIKDKDFQKILVGTQAPTKSGYYVKKSDGKTTYLLDSYIVNDLKSLITEPPKALPTPTPMPTMAPSPTATP
ncbi:MAG: DUF4340 domain-containing protein [Chloroflexota bacterium]|nr:MAG: DUF4340 domain-containing protein [Chloroflexota bacterium]